MRHKTTFEIDTVNYELTMMPGTQGLVVAVKLGKMFGDAVTRLFADDQVKIKDLLESEAGPIVARMLSDALAGADPYQLEGIVKTVFETLRSDGKTVDFDLHFQGRYMHMIRVFVHALKFNYADFFDASRSRLGPQDALAAAREEARAEIDRSRSRS